MFKMWISRFWIQHKGKIFALAKGVFLLCVIGFVASAILSNIPRDAKAEEENRKAIYRPKTTVMSGKDVSEEKYKEDADLIKDFVELCNSKDSKEAYKMLSEDCKKMFYPTEKDFVDDYLNIIFKEKRIYNLQSWVNKKNFVTYRIRILDDILSTGSYTDSVKYEDYITVNNNTNDRKISVNGFIKIEQINKTTQTNEFYAEVVDKITYLDYEEYTVKIKNLTSERVVLDSLQTFSGTVLVGDNDVRFFIENIRDVDLLNSKLSPQVTRTLKLKFKKSYSSDVISEHIEFKNIIKNIYEYDSSKNYTDYLNLKIEL